MTPNSQFSEHVATVPQSHSPKDQGGFRSRKGLMKYRLKSGTDLVRIHEENQPPPYVAKAWWDEELGAWRSDFGGRWLELGSGKLFWEWR